MKTREWLENELLPKAVKHKSGFFILGVAIVALDFLIWYQIVSAVSIDKNLKLEFLDVDQGDSELVMLPGGVKVLIDGGPPNGKLIEQLAKILPPTDRYIDLVLVSHPQLDHFGGLIEVLKRYQIGAFLWNGRNGEVSAWDELRKVIKDNKIQLVVLTAGDKISYAESRFDILSPTAEFLNSKELNDTALVAELSSKNSKTLFTGDIGFNVEKKLPVSDIDILKVAHHGSKYSSGADFLKAFKPEIAVIEVGKNTYGHPTKETLTRLENAGAKVLRTDQGGNVELVINGKSIGVFEEKKISAD